MHERGKSDSPLVPAKPLNKTVRAVAEVVEGRGLATGNMASATRPGHRAGPGAPNGLDRVRESARKDKGTTPSSDARFHVRTQGRSPVR
jgi:RNA-directed DNA polymerase